MKIHYHSDCPFFAGCEKMLVNLWLSEKLRSEYQISFSYRDSPQYTEGMLNHLVPDFPVFPLKLPPLDWPNEHFPKPWTIFSKGIRFTIRFLARFIFFLYETWVIFGIVKKLNPDIVHLNNGGYPAARSVRAAAIGARLAGCQRIVMVVNNLAVPYQSLDRYLDYVLDRWVVLSTTKFITGSIAASQRLSSVLALNSTQVQAIHNGIILRNIDETKNEVWYRLGLPNDYSGLVCGIVALMIERKGHRFLVEAIAILKHEQPRLAEKLVVWFEGHGDLKNQLETMVDQKNVEDVIKFIGDEKNIFNFLNAIDVLILPSIDYEDFPNVTLEAMALGKAVIASNLAGTPEQILAGKTGYLVEPRTPETLAKAIQTLMSDRFLVQRMGKASKKRFDNLFRVDIAVDNYLQLYQALIKLPY